MTFPKFPYTNPYKYSFTVVHKIIPARLLAVQHCWHCRQSEPWWTLLPWYHIEVDITGRLGQTRLSPVDSPTQCATSWRIPHTCLCRKHHSCKYRHMCRGLHTNSSGAKRVMCQNIQIGFSLVFASNYAMSKYFSAKRVIKLTAAAS